MNKLIVFLLSILLIVSMTNTAGIYILSKRQEKNMETLNEQFEKSRNENTESFATLQAYLMDSFSEQNKVLKKTNSIATQKTAAEAEQSKIISNDMTEGLSLMSNKEYAKAKNLFDKVVALQPYNNEAKFYSVYSLFLQNKRNRANYKQITQTFSSLRGAGYSRREMEEVEKYITEELESMEM